jgi:hypothetical protein
LAPAIGTNTAEIAARAASSSSQAIHVTRFDHNSERDWYELMRDIVALANSGGGRISIGVSVEEGDLLRRLDRHTDSDFRDVHVLSADTSSGSDAVVDVGPAVFPVGFSHHGTCGTNMDSTLQHGIAPVFYFRHGERTEQGTTADMRAFVERLLRRVRRRWLRSIRRVLRQPMTFDAAAAPKRTAARPIKIERTVLQPVRIVSDPNAPALQPQDVDRLYPWRQKDLLQELNNRIGRRMLTTYDVQAVRRHHGLDERPDFVFHLPGAGRRYSPAVADWIMEQYARNAEFFHKARAADQEMLKLRRKKPR